MNWLNNIFSVMISSIVAIYSIGNLINEKISRKNLIIFVICMFIPGMISCTFFDGIPRLIINIIITCNALYFSIFKKDFFKSLYYCISYEILVFSIEFILSIFFVLLFNFNIEVYEKFSFSLLLFSVINCFIVFIITKIKLISLFNTKMYGYLKKNKKYVIYVFTLIILMIMLITFNKFNLNNNLSFYINIGMAIFVLLSFLYVFYNSIQKDKAEYKYIQMMDYVSKYEKIINEQGKRNHEYNNQLMVLKGYVNNKEKLIEYLNLIVEEQKGGQNYTIKQLGYLPDGGIKGLIYHKLIKAEENSIKPYLYIDQSIKDIFETKFDIITYKDITKILGVLFDNAIDAAKDSKEKEIEFDIKNKDNSLIITISNSYNKNVDTSQIGKKGYSTKGVGHGFGLSIVKDITRKNNSIETFNENTSEKFIQTVIIFYQN